MTLLEKETGDSGFFVSGPGFGGSWPRGVPGDFPIQLSNTPGTSAATQASRRPVSRPSVISTFKKKTADEEFQLALEFIKNREVIDIDVLPAVEQMMVNFSKQICKVFSPFPKQVKVRLVDPNLDISTAKFTGKGLREPVERDCESWMKFASPGKKLGRQFLKPIVFIPPRGFLISTGPEDEAVEKKVEKMQRVLTSLMDLQKMTPISREKVSPGMPAVLTYIQGAEVTYYRVIVMGNAHYNNGDVLTLLMDVENQYYVDAKFEQLYEIPVIASFNVYPSQVIYANIFGIRTLPEEEQAVVWRNVDDDKRKKDICMVIVGESSRIPLVDMVWRDELGQLEWLSKILQRRGATLEYSLRGGHLDRAAESALPAGKDVSECVMDYIAPKIENPLPQPIGCSPIQPSATPSPIIPAPIRMTQRIPEWSGLLAASAQRVAHHYTDRGHSPTPLRPRDAPRAAPRTRDISPIRRDTSPIPEVPSSFYRMSPRAGFRPNNLNIYAIFDDAIQKKKMTTIFGVTQFVRTVLPSVIEQEEVDALLRYMSIQALVHLDLHI